MSTVTPVKVNADGQSDQSSTRDPLDIPSRFEELKTLKDGWLDGSGVAPSHQGLDWLARILKDLYPDSLPSPYAYPVPEGGVQLERSIKRQEISLEIDFESKLGEWHSLDLDTNRQELKALNLANVEDWRWVIARLSIAGATR